MVKITMDTLQKVSEQTNKKGYCLNALDIILEEQGKEFAVTLAMAGQLNLEMLRGFIACYFCFRASLPAQTEKEAVPCPLSK